MRESVRAAFYSFNAPMEGEVPYFYQDVKGLVSIGVGLLLDTSNRADQTTPPPIVFTMPMVHPDGRAASMSEILEDWQRVNALGSGTMDEGNPAARGGHLYARPHTRLRLTQDGLIQTVVRKLLEAHRTLLQGFPDFETWPADAQLGALSLAWACGANYWRPKSEVGSSAFPKLTAALRACDFMAASVECFMPEEKTISGLRPRNRANRTLFQNAAIVVAQYLDPDRIYFPKDLTVATAVTDPPPATEGTGEPPAPVIHPAVPLPAIKYDFTVDDADEDDG